MKLIRFRLRLAIIALVCGGFAAGWSAPRGEAGQQTASFIGESFDLEVTDESVNLVSESAWPLALGYRTVVFLASRPREPRDLYRAEVRMTPTGRPIAARRVAQLTKTSAGDEDQVVVLGTRVATRTKVSDLITAVTMVDLHGENEELRQERSGFWKMMWAGRNLIEFGTTRGVERHSYQLLEPAADVELALADDGLRLSFGETEAITGSDWSLSSGAELVEHHPPTAVQPSLVPFTVDTVRLITWFGPAGIEWMEHIFFAGLDLGRRSWETVGGNSTTSEELAHEMGVEDEPRARPTAIDLADLPDVDFPPPDLTPIRDDAVEGEGRWRPMTDERFVRTNPGAPPAFASTFIRPDTERGYAETFIVIWDTRQVELNPVAGTVEPMSATGVLGSGLAPRDQVERMVGGFNGGFQATHGEYGMMMEGTLFIPPKGYASTVATLVDGRTGFGTWSEEVDVIPPEITAFRQNMTAVTQDGRVNPYGRNWWGAAPHGARDPTYTQRSGVCLTEEGFAAYFWGTSMSPESLGAAMVAARCVHGTHLDMNAMLTGFEFYHIATPEELPPLDREIDRGFEYQGRVPYRTALEFRSRRLARGMKQINFPRYIRRDTRDFFWLKLRHVLPGSPLSPVVEPALEGEGAWRVKGLPVGGFPPSFARTFLRPDPGDAEGRVELVLIDPYVVRAARGTSGEWPTKGPSDQLGPAGTLAAIVAGAETTVSEGGGPSGQAVIGFIGSKLIRPAVVTGADELTEEGRATLVSIVGTPLNGASRATMALARHPNGWMVVALEPNGNAGLLRRALEIAGAELETAVALGTSEETTADLVFYAGTGEERRAATLSGREPLAYGSEEALILTDGHFPQGVRMFPDVPVVPRGRWLRFLNKREVYLRNMEGQYHHVTGEALPRQAPLYLKALPGEAPEEPEEQ